MEIDVLKIRSNGADPQPGTPGDRRRLRRSMSATTTRRALAAVAVGAVVAAIATFAISGGFNAARTSPRTARGSGPQATGRWTATRSLRRRQATASTGRRRTIRRRPDGLSRRSTARTEHRFEVAGAARPVACSRAPSSAPVRVTRVRCGSPQLRDEHCTPVVELVPRLEVRSVRQVQRRSDVPQRVRLGVGRAHSALRPAVLEHHRDLLPFVGRVAEQDQSNVWDAGTCIGINQNVPTDPVDCAQPHAFEVISVVDLGHPVPRRRCRPSKTRTSISKACARRPPTSTSVPPTRLRNKTLTLFWDNIELDSWLAGSRRVNCSVGKEIDTGGFVDHHRSAKGEILINGAAPVPPPPAPEGRSMPTPLPGACRSAGN